MQPNKTTVIGLFSTPQQYQIPIFQRGYVWTLEKQVGPLWADIQDRADAVFKQLVPIDIGASTGNVSLQKHFLGSIVMTPIPSSFGQVSAFEVIDGQQRSTTLQILLLAFRHAAMELNEAYISERLSPSVRNHGPYDRPEDYYKVWPTQAGQDEIRYLNNQSLSIGDLYDKYPARDGRKKIERPLMVQTFIYLYHACLAYMRGVDLADETNTNAGASTFGNILISEIRRNDCVNALESHLASDPKRAQSLYMALSDQVQIMTLTLEPEDDPQVIFETLNARGEPLLASDLIRNFVFLEAARHGQAVQNLYDKYWSPFDITTNNGGKGANTYWREKERLGRLASPRIDLFFYNYTILRSQDGVLTSHVFQSFKLWWQKKQRDLNEELAHLVKSSKHFQELVSPNGPEYLSEFARLIKSLDVGTIAPVYLALRERLDADSLEMKQALGDLASYLTRRAVCGLSSKSYGHFFMRVMRAITETTTDPHVALRQVLLTATTSSEIWPDDHIFGDHWCKSPAYTQLRPTKVIGILRALEYAARGSKQGCSHVPCTLTIEHVMPQSWNRVPAYQILNMTNDQAQLREIALQGFGNLTLLTQPLNSSLSNLPFVNENSKIGQKLPDKRSQLGDSALLINTYFQKIGISVWNEDAIAERARSMLRAAILVWPRPVNSVVEPDMVRSALSGS
ncbi:MAG: DUF262 domain-containing HNH endonuclease family protein [Pseudomonas sp.]|uniref:DUF262 domain-containing protein n=1 Tax=Pseudomonas sp. TaxID=306 RepID=UPI0033996A2D